MNMQEEPQEIAQLHPDPSKPLTVDYVPIPEGDLPDVIARFKEGQKECLYTLARHPGWYKKDVARESGIAITTLESYLSHDKAFHSAWYTTMAMARGAMIGLTIAAAQESALDGMRKMINYGDTLEPGDKGAEANAKLRSLETRLKVAGVLKETPPVVFNAGQVLVDVAKERESVPADVVEGHIIREKGY
jgi:hypothetical protein|tara:strand:- start:212 stop:781 length:570 start_codon:yes stop_codon:yes gene_type:complete